MSVKQRRANKRLSKSVLVLYLITLVLALSLLVFFIIRMQEGVKAEKSAQALLEAYQQQQAQVTASPDITAEPAEIVQVTTDPSEIEHAVHDGSDAGVDATAAYVQPDAPEENSATQELTQKIIDKVGEGSVIGVLSIPDINIELPIISKWSYSLLKTSICRYKGPDANEKGNLVLIGHNYKSGAHFGRLSHLEKGSEVFLTGPDGVKVRYVVYSTKTIEPDDFDALEKWEGDCSLMLMTCRNSGTQRLLVKCQRQDS